MFSFELLHIFILGGLLIITLNYLFNLRTFRFPKITSLHYPSPRVSVLIPARNEESRLSPCLSTISDSDYPILEILVLDDHSTDGTAQLVHQRAKGDFRIIYSPANLCPRDGSENLGLAINFHKKPRGITSSSLMPIHALPTSPLPMPLT